MEFRPNPDTPLPHLPDDVTVPQFFFTSKHTTKPDRGEKIPWLIDDTSGRQYREKELKDRTVCLSNALHIRYGLGRDHRVLLYSRNHIDYPVATWAVHQLGGIISGANPDFSTEELAYQIREAKATIIIAHPLSLDNAVAAAKENSIPEKNIILFDVPGQKPQTKYPSIEGLVEFGLSQPVAFTEFRLKPGEGKTKLAFLSFSSGTTGKPKAVAIPHYSLIVNVIQWGVHHKMNDTHQDWNKRRFRPGDVAIAVLPFYHIYGLVLNLHAVLHAAMSVVVVPKFHIDSMLESIVRHRVTHLFLVPPHVVQLCKNPAAKTPQVSKQIRMITCGAAPLTRELNAQLFEMFPQAHIGQSYGMTEMCTAPVSWPTSQTHGIPGSSGHLLPGTVAKVVKPDGSLAAYGEPGDLWIKTPSAALGYANNVQATKETFIDGWVRSGDEVVIERTGEVVVLDRIKEIMKVRGFQVAPAELEGCLLEHPDVSNACVVGIPDDYSGEVPLAFVALTPQSTEKAKNPVQAQRIRASIIEHVAKRKIHYKHLKGGVEFVPRIPTSPSGKLLRRVLREQAKTLQRSVKAKL
ncbi:phenylacetyl-CoA ligase [Coprinopsis sp. MPI-PUGE-AT-0042]|nr:phenylacetyl-CoA ligase [Coprinopsis sp. MPI-PUGE-AT-0042]